MRYVLNLFACHKTLCSSYVTIKSFDLSCRYFKCYEKKYHISKNDKKCEETIIHFKFSFSTLVSVQVKAYIPTYSPVFNDDRNKTMSQQITHSRIPSTILIIDSFFV